MASAPGDIVFYRERDQYTGEPQTYLAFVTQLLDGGEAQELAQLVYFHVNEFGAQARIAVADSTHDVGADGDWSGRYSPTPDGPPDGPNASLHPTVPAPDAPNASPDPTVPEMGNANASPTAASPPPDPASYVS